jgi:NAD(P)-dependent dehydrogenase (short-subunit alcohol dehydrogenase family)
MAKWTTADIPSQADRVAIVTGTGGLGYETALALAAAGATVVLAGRSEKKGLESVANVRTQFPRAQIRFAMLDLASLASVADFSHRFASDHSTLDLLVNNAGVMSPPKRQTTADGFELQFGTNYLGHFALTAHLLPQLRRGRAPRVVNVSSGMSNWGAIRFDDLQWERSYKPARSYAQSKLANLMFALELQRRSDANRWGLMSNAAHPGYALTELIPNGPGPNLLSNLLAPFASQSAAEGALPTLFAATAPDAKAAAYYGPDGFLGLKGAPGRARIPSQAKDLEAAKRLWEVSERLTGATFNSLTVAA